MVTNSWTEIQAQHHPFLKKVIAKRVVDAHLSAPGQSIRLGTGSTAKGIFCYLLDQQIKNSAPLDQLMTTVSGDMLQAFQDVLNANPGYFQSEQFNIVGGVFHARMNAFVGVEAINSILNSAYCCDVTVIGASSVRFDGGELAVTYQFPPEIEMQAALAMAKTGHLIFVFDGTKLDRQEARGILASQIKMRSILRNTDRCTFVTAVEGEYGTRTVAQINYFESMLTRLAESCDTELDIENKEVCLEFVDPLNPSRVERSYSLQDHLKKNRAAIGTATPARSEKPRVTIELADVELEVPSVEEFEEDGIWFRLPNKRDWVASDSEFFTESEVESYVGDELELAPEYHYYQKSLEGPFAAREVQAILGQIADEAERLEAATRFVRIPGVGTAGPHLTYADFLRASWPKIRLQLVGLD
jgi:DeoR/GlpR family transcriptional regulator of sugar metabolism